ncbi:copper ABC transporter permease [Natrialba hulunbeirensis JCM 10989]|uniref:Copper ABC transporter permease n=1 Tax=Natrialba hulunbeirensis JCM 10989 TaxID=1227493 RepID=L9ZZ10_9EURY|nr:ABC transporter permease subunit [Natrialba hulunbeirensis]ELY90373.1 copper ABC transporter permease [Natrialba hulunbeirensis JCM 10989]
MSALDVARKDFLDARRSKIVWLAIAIYVGFIGLFMVIQRDQLRFHDTAHEGVVSVLVGVVTAGSVLIPVVALVAAYLAIAGERETGSIAFLLGLPNTRRDVVVGKFVSRSAVIVLGVVCASLVMAVSLLALYPVFPVRTYLVAMGLMALYAVIYVAIAIGISASVASKARAAAVGFGVYVALNVFTLFAPIGSHVRTLHTEVLGFAEAPTLYRFVSQLVPSEALSQVMRTIDVDIAGGSLPPADAPFYVQPEFAPVVLCAWIVAPLAVGYTRFKSADVS